MYKISELAEKVGLSRTALLYYEKIQLITGKRLDNGYRVYNDNDLQRIRLIQQLQLGGLTLKECKACLETKIDKAMIQDRLNALDQEIQQKQQARELLAAIAGQGDLKVWHQQLDQLAPDAHLEWLSTQGFSDKEALHLKWLSKNMNEHDIYMNDFMTVFETLERWGPGSKKDTRQAINALPTTPSNLLEIGCGKGLATEVLMESTPAQITAIDNEQSALDRLQQRFIEQDIEEQGSHKQGSEEKPPLSRLNTVCANMAELPFDKESFDLLWAEGSAYIIGIEKALSLWKPFIKQHGYLMVSDMVWKTASPSQAAIEFWNSEYPDIQQVETRLKQMEVAGYRVINHFPQSEEAWLNYYAPLGKRVKELENEMSESAAFKDIEKEVSLCTEYSHQFGYHMFILQKC
ncbi:MerR family transcriptional regulator [Vibrio sp. SS-MA-C1-2]|uniref:MerR family transcriptional regulator n=1 Tax=Vibrio sp. SS-MA-C1-2 TaxID=2908646 RepID=UPI001F416CE4|nr:MerR family transcriptional regulator [Vibrio sp. SS-MA-C1-2]UJF17347.1 MerR family transcriptional regulator [Vibrio sp. SS-MA-C1-2]